MQVARLQKVAPILFPNVIWLTLAGVSPVYSRCAEFACSITASMHDITGRGTMGEIIRLASTPEHRPIVKGVHKASSLACTQTSAPDVFVRVVISSKEEQELHRGDDIVVPAGGNLTIRLFRRNVGNQPYSAELDLSPVAG